VSDFHQKIKSNLVRRRTFRLSVQKNKLAHDVSHVASEVHGQANLQWEVLYNILIFFGDVGALI
jgi:hypothetical protein